MTLLKRSEMSDAEKKMQREIIAYLQAHGVKEIATFNPSAYPKESTNLKRKLIVKG